MENSPYTNETDISKKEASKPKRRKPETIGFVAVKPESGERDVLERRHPKANLPPKSQQAPEHIGHMLMVDVEKSAAEHSQPLTGKRVDTLSRAELFSLAETIIIDGSSLRQIYETHLVGERGLRRLVAEHLRGGDLKKALRSEIIEREIDFERDPDLRDMVPGGSIGNSKVELNKLLEQATVSLSDSGEEAAFFKARAIYESHQLQQHKKQRRFIDISLGASIVVLITLVITLYLSRN